jgi:hypothetical protein
LIKLTDSPGLHVWSTQDVLLPKYSATLACCVMLKHSAMATAAAAADAAGGNTLPPAAAAAAATSDNSTCAASCPGLPWLVLFGRVCSQWGDLLSGFDRAGLPLQQSGWQQGWGDHGKVLGVLGFYAQQLASEPLVCVADWLLLYADALAAAGYGVQGVQAVCDQLGVLHKGWQAAREAAKGQAAATGEEPAAAAVLGQLSRALQAFGAAVSGALPVPHFCNNPGCRNVSGDSEVALVSGHSCICAGCKVARYCGRSCQRACWKVHKPVCQALAAAADGVQM